MLLQGRSAYMEHLTALESLIKERGIFFANLLCVSKCFMGQQSVSFLAHYWITEYNSPQTSFPARSQAELPYPVGPDITTCKLSLL